MVEALVDWATFIHEHGVEAALARVDTTIAEREAARDRSALLVEQGDDANRSSEKIVEIRKTLDG
jgi:(E)-4-hydroxy-3-methylbut-2-enyl-diphosphate synthase